MVTYINKQQDTVIGRTIVVSGSDDPYSSPRAIDTVNLQLIVTCLFINVFKCELTTMLHTSKQTYLIKKRKLETFVNRPTLKVEKQVCMCYSLCPISL